jgi:predicted nucleotidyltransferase
MLDREVTLCREWAAKQREITGVFFYGSRVWGTPRPDSDLDVLVVAQPGAVIANNNQWTNELTGLLGVKVHLNGAFTADPELVDRIRSEGILVYSRHGDDRDFQFEELGDFDPDAN